MDDKITFEATLNNIRFGADGDAKIVFEADAQQIAQVAALLTGIHEQTLTVIVKVNGKQ